MAKSKDKNELEHLRGLIRELKAQNRHLKKTMSRKQKREYLLEDIEEREADLAAIATIEATPVINKEACPKCKGKLNIIDGAKIKVMICKDCNFRITKRI